MRLESKTLPASEKREDVSILETVILPTWFPTKTDEEKIVPPVVSGIFANGTETTPALKINEGLVVSIVKSGSLNGIEPEVSGNKIVISPPWILPIASTLSAAPV